MHDRALHVHMEEEHQRLRSWGGQPIFSRRRNRPFRLTRSKALVTSVKNGKHADFVFVSVLVTLKLDYDFIQLLSNKEIKVVKWQNTILIQIKPGTDLLEFVVDP